MAVLLRAPQTYLGVLEHALDRAGIPAWFHRGTRRPDPASRARYLYELSPELQRSLTSRWLRCSAFPHVPTSS